MSLGPETFGYEGGGLCSEADWLANSRGGCTLLAKGSMERAARLLYQARLRRVVRPRIIAPNHVT